jgi:hypothetical protein
MEERQEIVWASVLSCLFYFVCDGEIIIRSKLGGLDIRVNIHSSNSLLLLSSDLQKILLRIFMDFVWKYLKYWKSCLMFFGGNKIMSNVGNKLQTHPLYVPFTIGCDMIWNETKTFVDQWSQLTTISGRWKLPTIRTTEQVLSMDELMTTVSCIFLRYGYNAFLVALYVC